MATTTVRRWRWRSPWGALPILVVDGRIAAIALDPRQPLPAPGAAPAADGRGTAGRGPVSTPAAAQRLLDAAVAGRLSRREALAASYLGWATVFEREVLEGLARIPAGRTATYGELAAAIGRPRAARAVGGALGRNRLPVLLPCHRIVAASGIGGYGGGAGSAWRPGGRAPLDFKRALLAREGVRLP